MARRKALGIAWYLSVLATLLVSLFLLERERSTVVERDFATDAGPVTYYSDAARSSGPLIVVAHGFSGSRQMMQYISRDLARAGFAVVSFDFLGHGRNPGLLSKDVTRIEGTTLQLVEQTQAAIAAAQRITNTKAQPYGLLGHSMATDIIIRAAQGDPDAASIVAISMYSDAVTPLFPKHLLILSGEWEERLRVVGRKLIAQVREDAEEGQTVAAGDVTRRAVAIAQTEHVAVLFDSNTLREARDWFQTRLGVAQNDDLVVWRSGGPIALALIGIVVLFVGCCSLLPRSNQRPVAPQPDVFWRSLVVPAVASSCALLIAPSNLLGMSAFGSLLAFLAVWGVVQLLVLKPVAKAQVTFNLMHFVFFLVCGGLVFALALDRYAASFVPTGARIVLLGVFAMGTIPFAVADRLLVVKAPVWRRIVARVVPLGTLSAMMILGQVELGLLFATIPVLALFYLVFGTMAHAVAARSCPTTAGLALGFILAWSIAASMPLFAV